MLITNFAASSSGIGALGVDGQAFLVQLITFVLAFLVLRRYAFGPIVKVLRERRELIESGVKLGEEMRAERSKLDEEIETTLHKARQQADDIIAAAHNSARQAIQRGEDKAHQKASGILADAQAQIAQDTTRARKKLESELVGLISSVTEVIIDEKVDTKKDAQLIERAIKEQQPS